MKKHFLPTILTATLVVTLALWRTAHAREHFVLAIHSVLPDPSTVKLALNSMSRIAWVMAPSESGRVLAFVVYPERSDKAPVVIISDTRKGASDWARARRMKSQRKVLSRWSQTFSQEQVRTAAIVIRTPRRPR